jgi:hypothetical protein
MFFFRRQITFTRETPLRRHLERIFPAVRFDVVITCGLRGFALNEAEPAGHPDTSDADKPACTGALLQVPEHGSKN